MITRFWPLSVIQSSPLLPQNYAWELSRFYREVPSQGAYYAAMEVARRTPALEASHLVVIQSVGTPERRAYKDYPNDDEWSRLERTVVCETDDGCMFMLMDALH